MKKIKIDIKKKDGEYCVRWLESGDGVGFTRIEDKCYYTYCLEDAKLTANAMELTHFEKELRNIMQCRCFDDVTIERVLQLNDRIVILRANEVKLFRKD